MIRHLIAGIALFAFANGGAALAHQHEGDHHEDDHHEAMAGPQLENLLKTELASAEGLEVIVSRVTLPPNTALPKHWHPGEEFAYVIKGTVTLWQDGKPDTVMGAGTAGGVPLKQVHTAITGEEGATILVFRVHTKGQPERVPVE